MTALITAVIFPVPLWIAAPATLMIPARLAATMEAMDGGCDRKLREVVIWPWPVS